jgi:hypothetical protein
MAQPHPIASSKTRGGGLVLRADWTRLFCKAQSAKCMYCSTQKMGAAGGAHDMRGHSPAIYSVIRRLFGLGSALWCSPAWARTWGRVFAAPFFDAGPVVALAWIPVKPLQRCLLARKHFGGYPSILANADAESVNRGWFANNRKLGVHLALPKVCRYFYSETIPFNGGELSVHRETIHKNFVDLFLRCDITHLLKEPQGDIEYQAAAGGYEQKAALELDINVQIHILAPAP